MPPLPIPDPLHDQQVSHAVEVLLFNAWDFGRAGEVNQTVEAALSRINARAMHAAMVIVSTTLATALSDSKSGPMLSITIVCNWVARDRMESLQRQQALMNAQGRGGA